MQTDIETPTLAPPDEINGPSSSGIKNVQRSVRALLARIPFTDRTAKVLAVGTFSLLWLLVILVRSHISPDPKDLVTSSLMGLAALLQQGAVSGRDFLSTYGLAAQIWAWTATMLTTTKSALNAYAMIGLFFGLATAVLVAAVLLICDRISWKECTIVYVFGALLNLFLEIPNFTAALLLLIAMFAYRTVAATTVRRQIAWAASTGVLCFVAQLVMFQLVLYGVIVVVGTLVAGSVLRRDSTLLLMIKVFVAALALTNLGLVVWFRFSSSSYGLLFDYQGYALEMIRAFSMTMGLLWELYWANTLVLGILALYVIVMCVRAVWNSEPLHACLLLSLLFASLVSLNGALVRSDTAHIAQAFTPFVFLFVLIAWNEWQSQNGRLLWILVAMGLVFTWPAAGFSAPTDLLKLFRGEVSAKRLAREILRTSKPLELIPASVLTPENNNRGDLPLLVFPQETFIGIGMKRPLVSPILESQAAATETLQRYYVDALEKQRLAGLDIVYGLETEDFTPVDGVQAISRTPRIFEYIYKNFELMASEQHRDGHYVIRARREPRIAVYEDLPFTAPRQMAGSGMLKLEAPSTCGIVRVEMKLKFRKNPYLFRPSGIELNFNDGDQTVWRGLVRPLELNKPFTTYVSLLDRQVFHTVFGANPIASRKWDHLEYHPLNAELLGTEATRIEVTHLQCLNSQMFTLPPQEDSFR
ncbi:MAG: hypothetical protein DMG13_18625 [Acidobacteria bacterium]|nr:MAG: hypothetical protein DMG13_18625 [Acidobacteriota bacterium]